MAKVREGNGRKERKGHKRRNQDISRKGAKTLSSGVVVISTK